MGVVQGQAAYEYLQTSVDPMIQRLKSRMQVYDTGEAGTAPTLSEIRLWGLRRKPPPWSCLAVCSLTGLQGMAFCG